jgi:IS30 family transposase
MQMKYRTRIYYTEEQKTVMWDRWQKGDFMHAIARLFDRGHGSVAGILSRTGGIRPPPRKRSRLALTMSEREEISRGVVAGQSIRSIADSLGRAPSTVSREIGRNDGRRRYRANQADQAAWKRSHRPKTCKLAENRALAHIVAKKLKQLWSPQQIAGWLKRTYPDNENYQVSHETIYRSLYVQARGALKKELIQHLRTQRANKDTATVVNALIKQSKKLPRELYKSLTWDRGKELSDHKRFSLATDIDVYFCDPQSPWQRGSNENTNGLLRQYFPKGTNLSGHSQAKLNAVARQLNGRPRKTLDFETPAERFNQCVASIG